jgi:hypothetical protein
MIKQLYKIIVLLVGMMIIASTLLAQTGQRIQIKYEKANERLNYLKEIAALYPNLQFAQDIIPEIELSLKRAENLIQNQRLLLANQELNNAIRLIQKGIKRILEAPLKRQREKLNELIVYADSFMIDNANPQSFQNLEKAKAHKAKAIEYYNGGQLQDTLEELRLALFFANKAINVNILIREQATEEQNKLKQLYNNAREVVTRSNNATAANYLQLAERLIEKSEAKKQQQNYTQTIEYTHQATRLLIRAIDIASTKKMKLEIQLYDDLASVDELIENLFERIDQKNLTDDQRFIIFKERILELQKNAHDALDQNNLTTAQDNIKRVRRLIDRSILILDRSPDQDSNLKMENEQREFRIQLKRITPMVKEKNLPEANELLQLAQASYNRLATYSMDGNEELAQLIINVGQKFALAAEELVLDESLAKSQNAVQLSEKLSQLTAQINTLKSEAGDSTTDDQLLIDLEKLQSRAQEAIQKHYLYLANECLQVIQELLAANF